MSWDRYVHAGFAPANPPGNMRSPCSRSTTVEVMTMRQRVLESLGVAGDDGLGHCLSAADACSCCGSGPAAKAAGPAPKTTWGILIFRIWLDEFTTPSRAERGERAANKLFFTEDERAEQDGRRSGGIGRNLRVERGSQQDVAGAYNAVHVGEARRPADGTGCRSAERPNPRAHADVCGGERRAGPDRSGVPPGAAPEH